jgi:Protein kinase domain
VSSPANSSFSAEWPEARAFESARPGDIVAGFRIERLIGRGETGAVYEATQLSLGRAVALRLIDPARYADPEAKARLDRELGLASSLHHPGLVPIYQAGTWDGGRFVAMRLVRGDRLGSRSEGRPSPRGGAEEALQPLAGGLEAAHRVGLTHGAVRADNVLLDRDGKALLADLGLGRGRGIDADREGLTALRRAGAAVPVRRLRRAALAATTAGAVAAVIALLALGGGSGEERVYTEEAAPPRLEGTVSQGSELSPGPTERISCGGRFGGASSCTLVPANSRGLALRAQEDGVIRAWAVRGASGELTLQALRSEATLTRLAGFGQPVDAPDPGAHRFAAEVGVRRGDVIAVRLGPGAALGRRPGAGKALRWASAGLPLPTLSQATPLNDELLVRVDIEPGARPSLPAQIVGGRARAASDGATLAQTTIAVSPGRAFDVRLVRAAGGIQLDAFSGSRRTARLALPDADPGGAPILFEQNCGIPRTVCLRWQNPGEAVRLVHTFAVEPSGRFRVIG